MWYVNEVNTVESQAYFSHAACWLYPLLLFLRFVAFF
uniref:G_PROTEIN_RECEP_F2_4 domain-containing protein n=1 Tax=Heterorhabditis bacteriophora TaxID=37862 RepID=A0A1I7XPJ7_HETBA